MLHCLIHPLRLGMGTELRTEIAQLKEKVAKAESDGRSDANLAYLASLNTRLGKFEERLWELERQGLPSFLSSNYLILINCYVGLHSGAVTYPPTVLKSVSFGVECIHSINVQHWDTGERRRVGIDRASATSGGHSSWMSRVSSSESFLGTRARSILSPPDFSDVDERKKIDSVETFIQFLDSRLDMPQKHRVLFLRCSYIPNTTAPFDSKDVA